MNDGYLATIRNGHRDDCTVNMGWGDARTHCDCGYEEAFKRVEKKLARGAKADAILRVIASGKYNGYPEKIAAAYVDEDG